MKRLHNLVAACVSTAILAACGGNNVLSSSTPLSLGVRDAAWTEAVLHSFAGGKDGANPLGTSLIDVNGEFYGTTYAGGTKGFGTLFEVHDTSKGWADVVLRTFDGGKDGAGPQTLIDVNGVFYGTTGSGGGGKGCLANKLVGCGTIFEVSKSGAYSVLYRFKNSPDGAGPQTLIARNGVLYGTTVGGGANSNGTVYSYDLSGGAEKVLYSFKGAPDGSSPYGLIYSGGVFYGTTFGGGSSVCAYYGGCGTVFALTPSGSSYSERLLYSFKGGYSGNSDGEYPIFGLIEVGGKLYGTTWFGGALGTCGNGGCGTVYEVSTSGKERVLYRFPGSPDGANPQSGLIDVNGTFYGTTQEGGTDGEGAIFSVTTSGKEAVLYSFNGGSGDGANPRAGLTNVKGTLYGTTHSGGAGSDGTVFSLSP